MTEAQQQAAAGCGCVLSLAVLGYYFLTGNLMLTEKQKQVPFSPVANTKIVQLEQESRERKEKAKLEGKIADYEIDIGEDNSVSRVVGFLGSIPNKALFWSWDVGRYPTERIVRQVEDSVQNEKLYGLKIRIGHNEVLKDVGRLFNDENIIKRNPLWVRAIAGVPSTLIGETIAELIRSDYYNPITNTVTIYSNIDSFALHEIGHAKDWSKFGERPWIYTLARAVPPVTLYQEYVASFDYAKKDLSKEKKYHVARFLVPAFATYVLGMIRAFAQQAKKKK